MKRLSKRVLIGSALILFGLLFLIQQIFQLPFSIGGVIVGLCFAVGGCIFLYVLANNRENWWAAIPGFTLIGLGALIIFSEIFQGFGNRFGGTLFLGFIGLGFLVVYLLKRENWWAVIPAGVLATIALVAGLGDVNGLLSGGIFFLGIGATFAVVGMLPIGRAEKWPWIPGGILSLLGLILVIASNSLSGTVMGWVLPLMLLGVGGYFIVRTFIEKK